MNLRIPLLAASLFASLVGCGPNAPGGVSARASFIGKYEMTETSSRDRTVLVTAGTAPDEIVVQGDFWECEEVAMTVSGSGAVANEAQRKAAKDCTRSSSTNGVPESFTYVLTAASISRDGDKLSLVWEYLNAREPSQTGSYRGILKPYSESGN